MVLRPIGEDTKLRLEDSGLTHTNPCPRTRVNSRARQMLGYDQTLPPERVVSMTPPGRTMVRSRTLPFLSRVRSGVSPPALLTYCSWTVVLPVALSHGGIVPHPRLGARRHRQ